MKRIVTFWTAVVMIATSMIAASAQTPVPFDCETTEPTDNRPAAEVDPFAENQSVYYENGIWVSIPEDGMLKLEPGQTISFGPYQGWRTGTVTWMRNEGIEGFVIVSGERLDEKSDLKPQTPLSPQRQYVQVGQVQTGLAFPSGGCWKVTGTVGDHSITWVMDVRFEDEAATPTS